MAHLQLSWKLSAQLNIASWQQSLRQKGLACFWKRNGLCPIKDVGQKRLSTWASSGHQSRSGYLRSVGLLSRALALPRGRSGAFIKMPTLEASDWENALNLICFWPWQTPVPKPMQPLSLMPHPPLSPSPLPRCCNTAPPLPCQLILT